MQGKDILLSRLHIDRDRKKIAFKLVFKVGSSALPRASKRSDPIAIDVKIGSGPGADPNTKGYFPKCRIQFYLYPEPSFQPAIFVSKIFRKLGGHHFFPAPRINILSRPGCIGPLPE